MIVVDRSCITETVKNTARRSSAAPARTSWTIPSGDAGRDPPLCRRQLRVRGCHRERRHRAQAVHRGDRHDRPGRRAGGGLWPQLVRGAGAHQRHLGVATGAVYNGMLHVTDPSIPKNSGCFRPIRVVSPPGRVTNVDYPAPLVAANTETHPRLANIVIGGKQGGNGGTPGAEGGRRRLGHGGGALRQGQLQQVRQHPLRAWRPCHAVDARRRRLRRPGRARSGPHRRKRRRGLHQRRGGRETTMGGKDPEPRRHGSSQSGHARPQKANRRREICPRGARLAWISGAGQATLQSRQGMARRSSLSTQCPPCARTDPWSRFPSASSAARDRRQRGIVVMQKPSLCLEARCLFARRDSGAGSAPDASGDPVHRPIGQALRGHRLGPGLDPGRRHVAQGARLPSHGRGVGQGAWLRANWPRPLSP